VYRCVPCLIDLVFISEEFGWRKVRIGQNKG
jgi:hypothetical protein